MTQEERDLLIRIDEKLDNIQIVFEKHCNLDEQKFNDLNRRVAIVERAIWLGAGGLGMLQVILKLWRL